VLGAGFFTASVLHLSADFGDPNTGNYDFKLSQLSVIGPFADWYFVPSRGFHAQVAPGVANYIAGAGEPQNEGPQAQAHTAVGFGFMLGVGYDFWIGDEWSVGVLGRFVYATTHGSDNRHVEWSHASYSPAVMLSATYN
jgi:hypothetical protein